MLNSIRNFISERIKKQVRYLRMINKFNQGFLEGQKLPPTIITNVNNSRVYKNPLEIYFDSHKEGRGVWKWEHYFEIYHSHFAKFIDREVNVLEVGIYSGGSLDMWKEYFGQKCRIYGVDIEEACKSYENDAVKIFVGDQADRNFWKLFKSETPNLDIIIDDGGHMPHQQIVTLEEMLPHLRPGGVYLCEDVHGISNEFAAYIYGFSQNLNACQAKQYVDENETGLANITTQFQSMIHSVHLYPFVTVIEKLENPVNKFIAPKRGTQWQPFL